MYDNIMHLGMTLKQWREALGNQYSIGEIYRMIKDGKDLSSLASQVIKPA